MKFKPLLLLLLYAVLPFIVIYILFRINIIAGFLGIIAYILVVFIKNQMSIYRLKGQIEYKKGNFQNSVKWFTKAAKFKKAGSGIMVDLGFILLKTGKFKEAEKILLNAVEKSKTRDEKNMAKSNLALIIWKNGELDKAITMLKEVISEYKTTAVYGSLGYLVIEKGDFEEALKINLEAFDYNPDNAIIQDNLAHLYHLRGEKDKAGELFEKLIKGEPHFPEAYYDYGKYLEDMSEHEKAAEMYNKSLSCTFSFNNTITRDEVQNALDRLTKK